MSLARNSLTSIDCTPIFTGVADPVVQESCPFWALFVVYFADVMIRIDSIWNTQTEPDTALAQKRQERIGLSQHATSKGMPWHSRLENWLEPLRWEQAIKNGDENPSLPKNREHWRQMICRIYSEAAESRIGYDVDMAGKAELSKSCNNHGKVVSLDYGP